MVDSFLRSEFKDPKLRVHHSVRSSGRKLRPGISLRVGPFHLFLPSPFDTSAARCATRHPRFVRSLRSFLPSRGEKYPRRDVHRSVKSTLTRDRISKVFAMHLDYFSLHLFLIFFLRFFLFFFLLLELLIVYIHFFDIGEIENVGIYFSWKKEGKKKIWREV